MTQESAAAEGPTGLGGWLVLVAIGLVIASLRLLLLLSQTHLSIFLNGTWETITTPGNEAYHPLWAPILIFEIVGNAAMAIACVALLFLFFQKSRRFPPFYIALALIGIGFVVLDAWLGSIVNPDEPMLDSDTGRELGRSIGTALVWVPYMLGSKRVRNTFLA